MNLFNRVSKLVEGGRVWRELDSQLPEPVGVMEDDAPRLEKFKSLVENRSMRERRCLLKWLEIQLWNLERATPELQTAREEKLERKWHQIYNAHLEIVKPLV